MKRLLSLAISVLLAACVLFGQQPAEQGSIPAPQLTPGLMLRYHIDIRTTHDNAVTGAVENPQGGTQLSIRFSASLTLEALEPASGEAQVRATVEKVSVAIGGDTFDPSVAALESRYQQLEGFTTTIAPSRAQPPVPSASDAKAAVEQWVRALVLRIGAGSANTASEQPVDSAPLQGTVLRARSTYLRDEPCGGQGERAAAAVDSLAAELCAVILTHSTLTQSGSRRDQTPESYRERGLRSSGRWEGAGESLAYIARRTGWVVSITESQSEQMDFTINRAEGELVHRQRGRIETQTNLLLQSVEVRKF